MTIDEKTSEPSKETKQQPQKKPDESFGLNIEGKIKIFDPESGEVILERRA